MRWKNIDMVVNRPLNKKTEHNTTCTEEVTKNAPVLSFQICWLRHLKSKIKRFLPDKLRAIDKGLTTRGTDVTSTIAELATNSRMALVTKS